MKERRSVLRQELLTPCVVAHGDATLMSGIDEHDQARREGPRSACATLARQKALAPGASVRAFVLLPTSEHDPNLCLGKRLPVPLAL